MTRFSVIVLLLTILVACSRDQNLERENITLGTSTNLTIGRWSLNNFQPGLAQPQTYELGDIVWDFTPENKLNVKISVALTESNVPLVDEGQYSIQRTDSTVTLNGIEYDYRIAEGILLLSNNPELDGPGLQFTSIQ
jgi:hypothetical protein